MKPARLSIAIFSALALLAAPLPFSAIPAAAAAPPATAHAERTVRLTLSPAPPPSPALRYTLLPPAYDRVPGNAAPLYMTAMLLLSGKSPVTDVPGDLSDVLDAYLKMSDLQFARSQQDVLLRQYASAIHELDLASRREKAGWDPPIRSDGFQTLLPYLNYARQAARLLILQARHDALAGDPAAAVHSLQVAFALARHLQPDNMLIGHLVSVAIAQQSLDQLEKLVQRPDAPNLYWALANLPRPFSDFRSALQTEKAATYFSVPLMIDAHRRTLSEDEWRQLVRSWMQSLDPTQRSRMVPYDTLVVSLLIYPDARKRLVATGLSPDAVNAMSVPEVIGRAFLDSYDRAIDEALAAASLPPWQAIPALSAAYRRVEQQRAGGLIDLGLIAVPDLSRAFQTLAETDRHIALLQAVDALRAYAAAHDGHLPASLADITDTPVPPDPLSGKPFSYRRTGDASAELWSTPVPGAPPGPPARRYVIDLRK